ncbi:MAG: YhgE/Pip family protein [Naasia sp.]
MTRRSRRPLGRPLALAGLVLVPLAVVGLFAGALSAVGSDDARVPAAIVNQDEFVDQTAADGTTTPILAGRLLVTELTGGDSSAGAAATTFDWQVTGADQAAEALEAGEVYAVITIPSDFSASVVSLSTDAPSQAQISLTTDDAHGYLTGPLTDALGDGLAAIFGTQLSQQYIAGLIGGTGSIAGSLTEAADGASTLGDGARSLGSGLTEAATRTGTAQAGAGELAAGLRQYTSGVSTLSAGLSTAADQSAGLQQLPGGVRQYTGGVAASADGLRQVLADPTLQPQTRAAIEQVIGGLDTLGGAAPGLIAGADGAAALQTGVAQSAAGAGQLTGGSGALVSGADGLASGLSALQAGIGDAATGATQLGDGADQLESGLRSGAEQVPDYTDDQVADIARVAADPVALTTSRQNEVADVRTISTTLLVPAGLWLGALATFLVMGGPRRRILASPASTGRIVGQTLGRAAAVGAVQAVLLVGLLHVSMGVSWTSLPATLPFALLIALSFGAIHAALTAVAGRAGLVVSLVLLALQLTATGGLYPIELLSAPFRMISPLLPITGAVEGIQAIITGSGAANVVGGAVPLLVWGLVGALVTAAAVTRRRSARSLGLIPQAA